MINDYQNAVASAAAFLIASGIKGSGTAMMGSGHVGLGPQSARQSADLYSNASLSLAPLNKKNDTPPHLACDRCQAVCDSDIFTLFFYVNNSFSFVVLLISFVVTIKTVIRQAIVCRKASNLDNGSDVGIETKRS